MPQHDVAPRNLYLIGSVVLSAALVLVAVYLPVLNKPLGTLGLGASELAVVLVLFLCVEASKALYRRAEWTFEGAVGA